VRVATGDADALIGGDLIVSASPDALTRMQAGRTRVVVNCARTPTADFTRNPDWQFPLERMQAVIRRSRRRNGRPFRRRLGSRLPPAR
jgi:indolepyruvate ferredoxin oxidoreductase